MPPVEKNSFLSPTILRTCAISVSVLEARILLPGTHLKSHLTPALSLTQKVMPPAPEPTHHKRTRAFCPPPPLSLLTSPSLAIPPRSPLAQSSIDLSRDPISSWPTFLSVSCTHTHSSTCRLGQITSPPALSSDWLSLDDRWKIWLLPLPNKPPPPPSARWWRTPRITMPCILYTTSTVLLTFIASQAYPRRSLAFLPADLQSLSTPCFIDIRSEEDVVLQRATGLAGTCPPGFLGTATTTLEIRYDKELVALVTWSKRNTGASSTSQREESYAFASQIEGMWFHPRARNIV